MFSRLPLKNGEKMIRNVRIWPDIRGTHPGREFWISQILSFSLVALFLSGLWIAQFYLRRFFPEIGVGLLAGFAIFASLITVAWFASHLVSVYRSSNRLNSASGTACKVYVLILIGGVTFAIWKAANNELDRFKYKARQAEARVTLAAIYSGEMTLYAKEKRFSENLKDIGYYEEPDLYLYLIIVCDASRFPPETEKFAG